MQSKMRREAAGCGGIFHRASWAPDAWFASVGTSATLSRPMVAAATGFRAKRYSHNPYLGVPPGNYGIPGVRRGRSGSQPVVPIGGTVGNPMISYVSGLLAHGTAGTRLSAKPIGVPPPPMRTTSATAVPYRPCRWAKRCPMKHVGAAVPPPAAGRQQ
jgi:hypothetical protein